jgi:Uma2 family endonuclease
MSIATQSTAQQPIIYPESDGQPLAENTEQFRWIVTIKENLEALFQHDADVFVAGDLFWYPVEGKPAIRRAPDTLVVFGRPKGKRGSYRQWEEDGIAPQVVFEVLSPGNTLTEMAEKFEFYDLYGVEEYYIYDPDSNDLSGWQRHDNRLRVINEMDGWSSPRLGIRFDLTGEELRIFHPDGQRFLTFSEMQQQMSQAEQERQQAEQERQQAEQERQQAEQERQQAEERAAQLAARLREMGIDPDIAGL